MHFYLCYDLINYLNFTTDPKFKYKCVTNVMFIVYFEDPFNEKKGQVPPLELGLTMTIRG